MPRASILPCLLVVSLLFGCSRCCLAVDLSAAVVVTPGELTPREKKAVAMLVEEIEKRTQIRLPVVAQWPADG